jgi:hypothetical protein
MNPWWSAAFIGLWLVVGFLGFLLLGALRALGLLRWRLEQLEVALSGRLGVSPGTKAPAFSLPSVQGVRVALKGFTGRRVLLVFVQSRSHPWQQLLPELNRLQQQGPLAPGSSARSGTARPTTPCPRRGCSKAT